MPIGVIQFAAVMLTALALVPGGAHLLELRSKMALDRDAYMTVQRIYRGWALMGLVLLGAIAGTLWLVVASRAQTVPMLLASAACLLLLTTLATFFARIHPVNRATAQWTAVPEDFDRARRQWEYTHAANAVLTLAALAATVAASLAWRHG